VGFSKVWLGVSKVWLGFLNVFWFDFSNPPLAKNPRKSPAAHHFSVKGNIPFYLISHFF